MLCMFAQATNTILSKVLQCYVCLHRPLIPSFPRFCNAMYVCTSGGHWPGACLSPGGAGQAGRDDQQAAMGGACSASRWAGGPAGRFHQTVQRRYACSSVFVSVGITFYVYQAWQHSFRKGRDVRVFLLFFFFFSAWCFKYLADLYFYYFCEYC